MTPNRVRRVLVFLGAGACAGFLATPDTPHAASDRLPRSWVEFDSVRVTNPVFSPNSDGVKETVSFALTLVEDTVVDVHVTPRGLPDTVAVLVDSMVPDPRVQFTFSWNGIGSDSLVQPDGDYTVTFAGVTVALGDSLFLQRQVRIDVTAPTVEILAVDPQNYAPTTLHPGVIPKIRLRVSQSQLADSVSVNIVGSAVDQPLALAGGFSGDGDYVVPCSDCPVNAIFPDDAYLITAAAGDAAGNSTLDSATLDKNLDGPQFSFERPRDNAANEDPSGRFHFQFVDSIVGAATDERHTVDSVSVAIAFAGDTTHVFVPPRDTTLSTTYRFNLDVSSLLTAEGAHDLEFTGFDVARLSGRGGLTLVLDRTPDAPPVITPPLPGVTKQQILQFTVTVDIDAIAEVIIDGGTGPPDELPVSVDTFSWQRTLAPGPNLMSFQTVDYAGNISVADTMTVVWDTGVGLAIPERFEPGQSIQVDVGDEPAQHVLVRVLAVDGSLVRTFQESASRLVYTFPWDLTTPEGRPVKNGGYLVWVRVRYPDGREDRFRKMIAVVR